MLKLVLLFQILFLHHLGIQKYSDDRKPLPDGPTIDWHPERLLRWSDFKSPKNKSGGFAVATTTCGFGYDGIISGDIIQVNVYVRFYCNESWYDKDFKIGEVLKHEQLHFDICELYGRIFYKQILSLRKRGNLTENTLTKTLNKLRKEYDAMQDRYDGETNNSTNRSKQHEWERNIHKALQEYAAYSRYKEF
jgi:hypothetical protein